jgi:hypothetical protein
MSKKAAAEPHDRHDFLICNQGVNDDLDAIIESDDCKESRADYRNVEQESYPDWKDFRP